MSKISSTGISAATITGLVIFAATNSVLAVPAMPSHQMNQQMMTQLFSGKSVKMGNMTLGFRPGVMVMPLMCMTFGRNFSGLPMFGNMMGGGGAQANQSLNGLGSMMMHSGMIPSVCFSMSDAMLFRSMMAHGGSMNGMMGGNMTGGSAMTGGGK